MTQEINLAETLKDADMRVLLMLLFQYTGDEKWLAAPYLPRRDVNLIAAENAGLPEDIQAEIRAAAEDILSDGEARPAISNPDDTLLVRMMSTCLGEAVPPEYAPMMREQMGFARPSRKSVTTPPKEPVIIVGAGVSGIAMAQALSQANIPYLIIEKNGSAGGVWLDNKYPGCSVDTPNHAYSFSFAEPFAWSRNFSPREDIYAYLTKTVETLGLKANTRFGTKVVAARWDEQDHLWHVDVEDASGMHTLHTHALISAIGQLNIPATPRIMGQDIFKGPAFHTARWPQDLDLTDKSVAIIGTGASAMQLAPSIADQVKSLTIFQRSPQWVRPVPRFHDPIAPGIQWLLTHIPVYASWHRFTMFWRYGDGLLPTLRKDPDWPHAARSLNRTNERHRVQMAGHIEEKLAGRPDLIEKCMPDYPPFGKRILLDNGWFEMLLKPNVELVTSPIETLTTGGVKTSEGQTYAADVIIYSTGFKVTEMAASLGITGRNGQSLAQAWAENNPKAYLGITTPGFPNFFSLQGPNTGLGHGGSAIFQSECQAKYITKCLVDLISETGTVMDVRRDVHDAYVASVDAEHETLIWTHPGMTTYYRNAAGRVISVMPWRLVDYWHMTHEPNPADFVLETAAAV